MWSRIYARYNYVESCICRMCGIVHSVWHRTYAQNVASNMLCGVLHSVWHRTYAQYMASYIVCGIVHMHNAWNRTCFCGVLHSVWHRTYAQCMASYIVCGILLIVWRCTYERCHRLKDLRCKNICMHAYVYLPVCGIIQMRSVWHRTHCVASYNYRKF